MGVPAELIRAWETDIDEIVSRRRSWEQLSGAHVVVTGGAGFLGGYVVRTLLGLNRRSVLRTPLRVTALVREVAQAHARMADILAEPSLEIMEWDLSSLAAPQLGSVDYVVHAASHASPRFYAVDPVGTMLPNIVGTLSLLAGVDAADLRGFLFVSSGAVYGDFAATDVVIDEADYGIVDPLDPRSCYAEGKRAGESLCAAWSRQHGTRCMVVRPWHTYGPGLLPDDGRVFADFAFNVVRHEDIAMSSDGSASRAYCYATDAVAGLFDVLLDGEAGEAYNLANPAAVMSVLELAELLAGLFPERNLRVVRKGPSADSSPAPNPGRRLLPDVTKLARLGWTARVAPTDGFRRMINAYGSEATALHGAAHQPARQAGA